MPQTEQKIQNIVPEEIVSHTHLIGQQPPVQAQARAEEALEEEEHKTNNQDGIIPLEQNHSLQQISNENKHQGEMQLEQIFQEIDIQQFEKMGKQTNFFELGAFFKSAFNIMENSIQECKRYGVSGDRKQIQAFISGPLAALTKIIFDTDSKSFININSFAEGCIFLWKTFEFAIVHFKEFDGLTWILRQAFNFQPNFYNFSNIFDASQVLHKIEDILGYNLNLQQKKFDPHYQMRINSIQDIMKAKVSSLDLEQVLLDVVQNSTNVIRIKEALSLFKKFLSDLPLGRNYHSQLKKQLLPCYALIPEKLAGYIKQVPLNFVEKILKIMNYLIYDTLLISDSISVLTRLEFEMHFVYFQSQQLQHRVAGLTNIISKMRSIVDEQEINENFHDSQRNQQSDAQPTYGNSDIEAALGKYADSLGLANSKRFLAKWFKQKEVFEKIFSSESCHPEIVKRSFPLVSFLYRNQDLHISQIITIYNLASGKHHSLKSCLFALLNNIAEILTCNDLQCFLFQIKQTPLHEMDIDCLLLLKSMASNSFLYSQKYANISNHQQGQSNQQKDAVGSFSNADNKNIDFEEDQKHKNNGDQFWFDGYTGQGEDDEENDADAVSRNIEKKIKRNQNDFETEELDLTFERGSVPLNQVDKKVRTNKGRQYRKEDQENDINQQQSQKRIRIGMALSEQAVQIFEYLWQIIAGNSITLQRVQSTQLSRYQLVEQVDHSSSNSNAAALTVPGGCSQVVIEKAIAIMKELIEGRFKSLKLELLNRCVDMLGKEEMLDECLTFVKLISQNLPVQDANYKDILKTPEEFFAYLESKSFFQISLVHSLQKIKLAFLKTRILLTDSAKSAGEKEDESAISVEESREHNNETFKESDHSEDANNNTNHRGLQNQCEEEVIPGIQESDDKEEKKQQEVSQIESIPQETTKGLQEDIEKPVAQNLHAGRIRNEVSKIPYVNNRLLSTLDEVSSSNTDGLEKWYIESCRLRLESIVDSHRALRRSLSVVLVKQLFEIFCVNEQCSSEQELFYSFLVSLLEEQRAINTAQQYANPQKDHSSSIYPMNPNRGNRTNNTTNQEPFELLSRECAVYIFTEILLVVDINYYSSPSISCLESYFFYLNEYIKVLAPLQGPPPVITVFDSPAKATRNAINYYLQNSEVLGIQRFWDLCIKHPDSGIQNRAGYVLTRVLLAASNSNTDPAITQKLRQAYISHIMGQIKESYSNLLSFENTASDGHDNAEEDPLSGPKNQQFNQRVLKRSLELLGKFLLNIEKAPSSFKERSVEKKIIITCEIAISGINQPKFLIEVSTSSTVKDVFEMIGGNHII